MRSRSSVVRRTALVHIVFLFCFTRVYLFMQEDGIMRKARSEPWVRDVRRGLLQWHCESLPRVASHLDVRVWTRLQYRFEDEWGVKVALNRFIRNVVFLCRHYVANRSNPFAISPGTVVVVRCTIFNHLSRFGRFDLFCVGTDRTFFRDKDCLLLRQDMITLLPSLSGVWLQYGRPPDDK